ncbi:MAG: hypothetical protein M1546_03655, partial [Chloroflexi bacterium]|nr:hypothetical protein [Chloroflexota bacterium]
RAQLPFGDAIWNRNITLGIRVVGGGKDRTATFYPDQVKIGNTAYKLAGIQTEVSLGKHYINPNVQEQGAFLFGTQYPTADSISFSYGSKNTVKVIGGDLALQVDYTIVVREEIKPREAGVVVVLVATGLGIYEWVTTGNPDLMCRASGMC